MDTKLPSLWPGLLLERFFLALTIAKFFLFSGTSFIELKLKKKTLYAWTLLLISNHRLLSEINIRVAPNALVSQTYLEKHFQQY